MDIFGGENVLEQYLVVLCGEEYLPLYYCILKNVVYDKVLLCCTWASSSNWREKIKDKLLVSSYLPIFIFKVNVYGCFARMCAIHHIVCLVPSAYEGQKK